MKKTLTYIAAAPVLALFGGIGLLAWNIGQTWTQSDTQAVITATATICAGGMVVFALLAALIVGVPLAIRAYGEGGQARRTWVDMPDRGRVIDAPQWRELPPAADPVPPWQVTGGGNVDLLPPPEQDRRFSFELQQGGNRK